MPLNLQNVSIRLSAGRPDQFPSDPMPQVALSGRSNVGKSSLVNTLLGRKSFARVSSAPGKTVTVNFYDIDKKLFFVDLPGYGFAKRSFDRKETFSTLTDSYFTKNPNIDRLSLVVQLADSRVGITADDAMMLDYLNQAETPYVLVLTKTDKLNQTERRASLSAALSHPSLREGTPVIPFSSLKGEGRDELWKQISYYTEIRL